MNRSQSTNDTYPAACRLAILQGLKPLREATQRLREAFHMQADRHSNDIKIGRTQLQDAVPMTYGQEIHAWASFLATDLEAMNTLAKRLCVFNLGATAIGTGICADLRFRHLPEGAFRVEKPEAVPPLLQIGPDGRFRKMPQPVQLLPAGQGIVRFLKGAA